MPSADEARRLVDEFEEMLARSAEDTRAWLASPQGRRLRTITARALLLATPMILRHPFFRTPFGRVVELVGAAALVAKVADLIRDWEPGIAAERAAVTKS